MSSLSNFSFFHWVSFHQSAHVIVDTSTGGNGSRPSIASDSRSASIMLAALVLLLTRLGMIDASTTRRPSMPFTRPSTSTTVLDVHLEVVVQILTHREQIERHLDAELAQVIRRSDSGQHQ